MGQESAEDLTQFQRLSFGLEYGAVWQLKNTFFQRLRYRLGCAWEQPYYLDFAGNKLNSYFITAGFGYPFTSGSGSIDLAFEYGKNGKLSTNSFAEDVFRMSVYVSGAEKWFQR